MGELVFLLVVLPMMWRAIQGDNSLVLLIAEQNFQLYLRKWTTGPSSSLIVLHCLESAMEALRPFLVALPMMWKMSRGMPVARALWLYAR